MKGGNDWKALHTSITTLCFVMWSVGEVPPFRYRRMCCDRGSVIAYKLETLKKVTKMNQ